MGGEIYPEIEFKPLLHLGTEEYLISGNHEKSFRKIKYGSCVLMLF